jgi:uncharacterized protein CbrC (UPF0167 family)
MDECVIEITTEVFHLLQKRTPGYLSWSDEKLGPTQKVVLIGEVYRELIDRAIGKHKTLDQVIRDARTKN